MSFDRFRFGVSHRAMLAPEGTGTGDSSVRSGEGDAGAGSGAEKKPAAGAAGAGADKGGDKGTGKGSETIVGGTGAGDDKGKGGGKGEGDAGAGVTPTWPDNWRDLLAAGDADFRKQLDRLGSPVDAGKKLKNQDKIISSGQHKEPVPFPDKGTAEEQTAWRKDHGIPDAPDGYKLELGEGVVIGEADKPVVDAWLKQMHAGNASNAEVNRALATYYKIQDAEAGQLLKDDADHQQATLEDLQAEWGTETKRNRNLIDNLLGEAPDGLGALLVKGRLADGRMIGNDARLMRWLLALELDRNPARTLVPPGGDPQKGVETELADIRKFRTENPDKYDADKKMQARELALLEAQQKMQARAGKAA